MLLTLISFAASAVDFITESVVDFTKSGALVVAVAVVALAVEKPNPAFDADAKPKPGLLGSVGSSGLAAALPKPNDPLAGAAAVTAVGLNGLAVLPPAVGASAGGFKGSALPL